MASKSMWSPAGMPSRMTTRPLPCDSPAVRKRSIASSFYTKFLHCSGADRRDPACFRRRADCSMHVRRMATLIADRFLCRTCSRWRQRRQRWRDRSRDRRARSASHRCRRHAQRSAGWTEACARALRRRHARGFRVHRTTQRFEAARRRLPQPRRMPRADDGCRLSNGSTIRVHRRRAFSVSRNCRTLA